MKFIKTVVVFDQGGLIHSEPWSQMHEAYTGAVRTMVHPPGNDRFLIRRKERKLDAGGTQTNKWVRNGVKPIKEQFFNNLTRLGWQAEVPVGVGRKVLLASEPIEQTVLKDYPSKSDFTLGDKDWTRFFQDQLGEFDFYRELGAGMRCVIEWETGNISSSHRSMNKLCLVMMAGLIDIGVLVLPSRKLYPHLTDRIGSWEELLPYIVFWHRVGRLVEHGLLAVTVVEHDELTEDNSVPFISQGKDGRSAEGAAKLL